MIYLDYHATTPVDPRVAAKVLQTMTTDFGNASSLDHAVGDRAEAAVKQATCHIADLVGADPREILFTSGATESLNLAIQGTLYPIDTIAAIAQRYQVPFLCDACQAVGKIPIQFNEWGITMLALSAHKFYGP